MEWTIIRPGGLKNEPGTQRGVLTENRSVCGGISREDVAELVVKALFSPNAAGKVLLLTANSPKVLKLHAASPSHCGGCVRNTYTWLNRYLVLALPQSLCCTSRLCVL